MTAWLSGESVVQAVVAPPVFVLGECGSNMAVAMGATGSCKWASMLAVAGREGDSVEVLMGVL